MNLLLLLFEHPMNDHDFYRYTDYLDEDYYEHQVSQEMTREEKFWFVLVFIIFMFTMLGGAISRLSLFLSLVTAIATR